MTQTQRTGDALCVDSKLTVVKEPLYRCSRCQESKPAGAFYPKKRQNRPVEYYCIQCTKAIQKKWREDNGIWSHNRRYGLTTEDFNLMVDSQNGRCAICCDLPEEGRRLCVDHDHETGKVRALLCDRCNRGLGQFQDDAELLTRAIEYLKNFSASPVCRVQEDVAGAAFDESAKETPNLA